MELKKIRAIELRLLLEGIYQCYGYDFRDYAESSIQRRVLRRLEAEGLKTITNLQEKVLHDPQCMDRLIKDISITLTEFFRDPGFYISFRNNVIPFLRTYPFIRIWCAGCASGEEAYSLMILLYEEGLYKKSFVYATDFNEAAISDAKTGIFSLNQIMKNPENYRKVIGAKPFSEYFDIENGKAVVKPHLRKYIIFSRHNLATDSSFNEFNAILCRNVMIYFNKKLQDKVHDLIYDSLSPFGVLALGEKENLKFTSQAKNYEVIDKDNKIYRKIG